MAVLLAKVNLLMLVQTARNQIFFSLYDVDLKESFGKVEFVTLFWRNDKMVRI